MCPGARPWCWRIAAIAAVTAPHSSCPSTNTKGTKLVGAELEAAERHPVHRLPRGPDDEDVPEPLVEQQLRRDAGVDAREDGGERTAWPAATLLRRLVAWCGCRGSPFTHRRLPASSRASASRGLLGAGSSGTRPSAAVATSRVVTPASEPATPRPPVLTAKRRNLRRDTDSDIVLPLLFASARCRSGVRVRVTVAATALSVRAGVPVRPRRVRTHAAESPA